MTRRLSREALYIVLACLLLGTVILAQSTLRAAANWSSSSVQARQQMCAQGRMCVQIGADRKSTPAPFVTFEPARRAS